VDFSPQNGDEIRSRRQKSRFSIAKWRRDSVSSLKVRIFQQKTATRLSLIAKKEDFPPQKGDENDALRQSGPLLGHSLSNFSQSALLVCFK
jgi:hypothetical protein